MPLNEQQKANLEADAEALNSTLCAAWRIFYLMQGLHRGANEYPETLERCPGALPEIWRAQFWTLVTCTGTILDRTRNTQSLPALLARIRRYFGEGSDLSGLVADLEAQLRKPDGAFHKIEEWRHRVVAHNARDGIDVFGDHPMDLDEIEAMLDELTRLIGEAIWNSIAVHYYHQKEASQEYAEHGRAMIKRIAS
ncbi:hypothetical protein [Halomonas urmiana]|uniref:AbiU2 domain-containing protein n=1 Tax=Halomonas urmiana TaxID=490901 RepID=UPI0013054082